MTWKVAPCALRRCVATAILAIALCLIGHAQKRNSNWMTQHSWIRFTESGPLNVPGQVPGTPRFALSDTSGALEVYFNMNTVSGVYSSELQWLPSNPNYPAWFSNAIQAVMIIPRPGHPEEAYVIAATQIALGADTARYGILGLDLGADGAIPTVLDTGYTWFMQDACLKRMVIPHANDVDLWFVGQRSGTNAFYAYRLDCDGVSDPPVISETGALVPPQMWAGKMIPSLQGDRFACVSEPWYADSAVGPSLELLSFDPATGVAQHEFTFTGLRVVKGVEFSPSGRFLYATDFERTSSNYERRLFQYDLQAADILGSKIALDSTSGNTGAPFSLNALSYAPDGKIYMAHEGESYLGVINEPDLLAPNCTYVRDGYTALGSMYELPAFPKSHSNGACGLGVHEEAMQAPMVTPNPLVDHGVLKWPQNTPVILRWLDMQGREVRQRKAAPQNGQLQLDASTLTAGAYLLQVVPMNGSASVTQRVLVAH